MKKPDLLVLIAVWQFITAFMALVGIAAIAVFAFPAVTGYWDWGLSDMDWHRGMIGGVFGLSVAILFLVCFLALAVAGGIGLMLNRGREWARTISIVHSALSLFAIPIGTIIGTLSIIYLTKQEVRDYFSPPPPKQ
ncbi:MAG TPA: hypothetical protein VGA85_07630 [Dehalococcoidales bacterium]